MRRIINRGLFQKGLVWLLAAVCVFWVGLRLGIGSSQSELLNGLRGFTLLLWSILLEALPFVMLGTILSSLIQVFVTEDMLVKIMPGNAFLRLLTASLAGLLFPVCECAIIPITRGLLKKGLPVGPAIAFMLATPIVNPIVLLSTYHAFPAYPLMMPLRAVCGCIGAMVIGALVSRGKKQSVLSEVQTVSCACGCGHDHSHEDHACDGHAHEEPAQEFNTCECQTHDGHLHEGHTHDGHAQEGHACCAAHDSTQRGGHPVRALLRDVLAHTSAELQSVGGYLIFGAMIAAAVQMAVPTAVLAGTGGGRIVSILAMMALAFLLSLCSEADAFVASTFMMQFSGASVLAFLIVGPMIDIKNTMMMLGSFRKGFVIRLITTILLTCFALALIVSFFLGGGYA